MKIKSLFEYLKEHKNSLIKNNLTENLNILNEGGAFGHMSHPFDDLSLSFSQIEELTRLALSGELNKEETVTEKLDGQALAVSWKSGKLVMARNKGDLKNYGQNAPDALDMIDRFSGRGELSNAFTYAIQDLEAALSKLKEEDLYSIFEDGKKFMHLEIIYPGSTNVINYDSARLIFHSVTEYDENGNPISDDKSAAKKLNSLIKSVNADIQKNYVISEPVALKLPKVIKFDEKLNYFSKKLNKIRMEFGLDPDSTIEDYLRQHFIQDINSQDPDRQLTSFEIEGLLRRWVNNDKSFTLKALSPKIKNSELGRWIEEYDKKYAKVNYKKYIEPIEIYFLELGVTILKNMSGFLAANPDKVVQDIKSEVDRAIKELSSENDITKINKLNDLVRKIDAIGGFDSIVPSEGIVFTYNGKTYKFTGAFAPINKITGMLKFGR